MADAVPFELPASENWQDWEQLLTEAGFRYVRSASASPSVKLRAGAKWTLEIKDEQGQKKVASLDIADSPAEREAVVWIARSMLGGVALDPLEEPPEVELPAEVRAPLRPFASVAGLVGWRQGVAVSPGVEARGGFAFPVGLQLGAQFSGRWAAVNLLATDLTCQEYVPAVGGGYRYDPRWIVQASAYVGVNVLDCRSVAKDSTGVLPWGGVDIGVGVALSAGLDLQWVVRAGGEAGTITFDDTVRLPSWTVETGLRLGWTAPKKNVRPQ